MADYGKQNLLKHIIRACAEQNIQVLAWIPAFQHKEAWDKHPEWRIKLPGGNDYKPTANSYFLCPANPEVRKWWLGFLRDLLENYDQLEGIDIAEPIISWRGNRCLCDYHQKQNEINIRSTATTGLTETLFASVKLIHGFSRQACVTTVASVRPNGRILSVEEQIELTGFDLQNVLNAKEKPDWISVELMWQQWADQFNGEQIFTLEWTQEAAKTVLRQIDGRATVIGHLELTSFGNQKVDAQKLAISIAALKSALPVYQLLSLFLSNY